jgi:phage shock protein C
MMELVHMRIPLLYRDRSAGWIAGVCAGVGELTGIRPSFLRVSFLVGAFFHLVPAVLVYSALMVLLRPKAALDDRASTARGGRRTEDVQSEALYLARNSFGELEERLRSVESEVVARESELRRQFRNAGIP